MAASSRFEPRAPLGGCGGNGTVLSWVATAATIAAATITASNLGSRITGYGFIVFTIGSIGWFAFGLMSGQPALMWTNAALIVLNIFGVWRWLGRQARIEEGARAGAKASHSAPGEDLFPLSLLAKAPLEAADGSEIGRSVDAMAGCSSGRIALSGDVRGRRCRRRRDPSPGGLEPVPRRGRPAVTTTLDGRQLRDRRPLPTIERRPVAGPLIVTAELGPADFAWLDGLRRQHYPGGAQPRASAPDAVPLAAAGVRRRGAAGARPTPARRRRRGR